MAKKKPGLAPPEPVEGGIRLDRLSMLADLLEARNDASVVLDMSRFYERRSDGTVRCCAIGFACLQPEFQAIGLALDPETRLPTLALPGRGPLTGFWAVIALCNVPFGDAHLSGELVRLFMFRGGRRRATVVAEIREFVARHSTPTE